MSLAGSITIIHVHQSWGALGGRCVARAVPPRDACGAGNNKKPTGANNRMDGHGPDSADNDG